MSRRVPSREILFRLFDDSWESWELGAVPRRVEDAGAADQGSLAVPARQVVCSPLWIEESDDALVTEAAKLELEVRGLMPRAHGMNAVVLRAIPGGNRTMVVASVFPEGLPDEYPEAIRFDASPFLISLGADALTIWREGDDIVAAVTKGAHVVYWETNDRGADTVELRVWLGLIVTRLRGEGIITTTLTFANCVAGLAAERIMPQGCHPEPTVRDASDCAPNVRDAKWEWRPEAVLLAEQAQAQRARNRKVLFAVGAAYLVLAILVGAYFGLLTLQAGMLGREAKSLEEQIEGFQPVADEWLDVIGRTADPATFPLVILGKVVAELPPDGVRLTQFKIDGNEVTVAGEADSILIANDFTNKVAGSDSAVAWERQTPIPLPNNTAQFTILGEIVEK